MTISASPRTHSLRTGSLRDRVWALAELVTTPVLPSDYLDLIDPLRPGAALRGRIEDVRAETPDAATVAIRPGRSWAGHLPGQYVRLGIDIDGVRHWRPYSITSRVASGPERQITITVKAIPDGLVSNHLVRAVEPGTLVQLDQATGDFVMSTPRPAKALFVTGGSGITPVMGMLRNHLAELPDVVLLHSALTAADVIFAGELRAWHAAGRLRLVERHTDAEGMLDLSTDLDVIVPDWRERETWACGPMGLVDAAESQWAAEAPGARLHTERFRPAITIAGEGGTATFTRSGVVVESDGTVPLLDDAEAVGLLLTSGCRMGICFQCVLPLSEGAVRDLRDGTVTYAEAGDVVSFQPCVSAPAGPCHIDK
jgi:ferredoxin-NADP reductase